MRESMRSVPGQLLWSLLTGKPYRGQPERRMTPAFHVAGAFASLVVGLASTALGLAVATPPGFVLVGGGWLVTLHGMRNLRIMIFHHCAHRHMWGNKRLDQITGALISGLLVIPALGPYSVEHATDHHSRHHMSMRDPTVRTLVVTLGLRPGMTCRQMWRRLVGHLSSPLFHARFAAARVRGCVEGTTLRHRIALTFTYGLVALLLTRFNVWTWFLVGWVFPLTVPFQVANTLRLCARHTFPSPGERIDSRSQAASFTSAVFLGEAAPSDGLAPGARWAAWLRWLVRMAAVHFPSRYLVLTGDTVCHDFHHRHPNSDHWANYIFARQRDVETGQSGSPPLQEVWGLVPAINHVFESLSLADPEVYNSTLALASEPRRFDD